MYTDLQSIRFSNEINTEDPKKYHDKDRTAGELDTGLGSQSVNEKLCVQTFPAGANDGVRSISKSEDDNADLSFLATYWRLAA